MLREVLIVTAMTAIAGCEAGVHVNPDTGASAGVTVSESARLAAYAASVQYPVNARATADMGAIVMVNRRDNSIQIINPSERPILDVNVWINGGYVCHVDSIPAHGSLTLGPTGFYNNLGQHLSVTSPPPTRIEIQRGNELYLMPMSYM